MIPFSRCWYQFSVRNTKIYKICNLHRLTFSTFYNVSQLNFAILQILGCSSMLYMVMNFPISTFFKILPIMQSVHCHLCLGEKLCLLKANKRSSLNKRSELFRTDRNWSEQTHFIIRTFKMFSWPCLDKELNPEIYNVISNPKICLDPIYSRAKFFRIDKSINKSDIKISRISDDWSGIFALV